MSDFLTWPFTLWALSRTTCTPLSPSSQQPWVTAVLLCPQEARTCLLQRNLRGANLRRLDQSSQQHSPFLPLPSFPSPPVHRQRLHRWSQDREVSRKMAHLFGMCFFKLFLDATTKWACNRSSAWDSSCPLLSTNHWSSNAWLAARRSFLSNSATISEWALHSWPDTVLGVTHDPIVKPNSSAHAQLPEHGTASSRRVLRTLWRSLLLRWETAWEALFPWWHVPQLPRPSRAAPCTGPFVVQGWSPTTNSFSQPQRPLHPEHSRHQQPFRVLRNPEHPCRRPSHVDKDLELQVCLVFTFQALLLPRRRPQNGEQCLLGLRSAAKGSWWPRQRQFLQRRTWEIKLQHHPLRRHSWSQRLRQLPRTQAHLLVMLLQTRIPHHCREAKWRHQLSRRYLWAQPMRLQSESHEVHLLHLRLPPWRTQQ